MCGCIVRVGQVSGLCFGSVSSVYVNRIDSQRLSTYVVAKGLPQDQGDRAAEKCRVTVGDNTDRLLEQTSMGSHALSRE
jgi:hypothetical protein